MGSIAPLPPGRDRETEPDVPFLSRRINFSQGFLIALASIALFAFIVYPRLPTPKFERPSRPSPDDPAGFSASWDMAAQSNRARATHEELQRCFDSGDTDCSVRVMQIRASELTAEIGRVTVSPEYSVSDKQKMLKQLEHERAVYIGGLRALASIR